MNIFISADIEGISGIFHSKQTGDSGAEYERAKKLMTDDVNAAIEGALEAGAEKILVNDSHGSMRNIIIEDLNPAARLISGFPKPLFMLEGLDSSFDGLIFIGYHAMSRTKGILAHTVNGFTFHSIKMNGVEYGESEINAAVAAHFNVPVIMASGDNYLGEEIVRFLPWVEFAEVKIARGSKSADCLTPLVAARLIKEKVKKSILNLNNCEKFVMDYPIKLEVKFNSPLITDVMEIIPGTVRISSDTVIYNSVDILDSMKMIFTMSAASCLLMMDSYR